MPRQPYAATNENLMTHGLKPAMRWLIAVALDGSTITYGELKEKLERQAGFLSIFATKIGFVAGALMDKIQAVKPDAPLINLLVVNQQDRLPSSGAGQFMAARFNVPRLAEDDAKEKFPTLWQENFERGAGEVYSLTEAEWSKLFKRVFGEPLAEKAIDNDRDERQQGSERDGVPTGRIYGNGGESTYHKNLRLWIRDNPTAVHPEFGQAAADTEVDLDSGDRVDVVYKCMDRTIVIEVKSRISNNIDLRRGVFQCVKYRAVRKAMDVRQGAVVEAYLVTEEPLPGEISALLDRHDIRHFQAPLKRDK